MDAQICPMEDMKRLLVATDGSAASRSAVEHAIHLAKVCSSDLIAMTTVLTNSEQEDTMPWVVEQAEKEMQDNLVAIKQMASRQGVLCETFVYRGEEPYRDIVNAAAMQQADMIVMGTHGRSGIKKLIMGSVTRNVIGHAPGKILVIPAGIRPDYSIILLATDGSPHSAASAREATAIAKRYGSLLLIVAVAHSPEEVPIAEENIKPALELAEKAGVKKERLVLQGKPQEAIPATAAQRQVGLIVIGSHGKTGLSSLFMGSVAEGVIVRAQSAVLVVKPS